MDRYFRRIRYQHHFDNFNENEILKVFTDNK